MGRSPYDSLRFIFALCGKFRCAYVAQAAARSLARNSAINPVVVRVPDHVRQRIDKDAVLRLDLNQLCSARGRRVFGAATLSRCPG